MNFATLAEIKNLNDPVITADDFDDVLSLLMDSIGTIFDEYCNRSFQANEFTEFHGGGGEFLYLRNNPIREIVSIYTDIDREFEEDNLVDSADYELLGEGEDGVIYSKFFLDCPYKSIKVIYSGGYDPIDIEGDYPVPADLKMAYIRQVQHDFKRRRDIGMLTVTFKDGSITKPNINELLPQVVGTLDRYRWVNI